MDSSYQNIDLDNKSSKVDFLTSFLWFCAGINRDILKNYPTEHNKYAAIGATILCTAILAIFSGGYAVFTIFGHYFLSAIVGLFWGGIIFTLDRFFVISIKETGEFWRKFLNGAPRLVLAVFLGLLISKPLEVRLFEPEITDAIKESKEKYEKKKLDDKLKAKRNNINNKIIEKEGKIKDVEQKIKENQDILRQEILGLNKSQLKGEGNIAKGLQNIIKSNESYLDKYKNELSELQKELSDVESEQSQDIRTFVAEYKSPKGLLIRLETLETLGNLSSDTNTPTITVKIVNWLVSLLFIFMETAPIMTKIFTPQGPYASYVDRIEYQVNVEENEVKVKLKMRNRANNIRDIVDQNETKYNLEVNKLTMKAKKTLAKVYCNRIKKGASDHSSETPAEDIENLSDQLSKVIADSLKPSLFTEGD